MKLGISNDASELDRAARRPTEEPLLNHRARGVSRNVRRTSRVQR